MPRKRIGNHVIALALSREGTKYSLHLKPGLREQLAAAGVTGFKVQPTTSSTLVMSLHPVFGTAGPGVYALQNKDGHGHVEFPVSLVNRVVGVVGKACAVEATLFSGSVLQVRRPTQEAVSALFDVVNLAAAREARKAVAS